MIEIRHLTKRYGSHTAVSDLSLTVEPGKIYGFLGPNGAGKSTTMNIMTGCLSATEGSVLIDGHDIFEEPDKAKALIGYLPELPPVYPDMSPREYLTFVARAKGVSKAEREKQIENALAVTQTDGVQNRLIRNLSKGYRQRVGIAQAFELRTASGRVHLGNREYQMMELLMRGRGRRICAEEIAQRIWGEEKAGSELIWVHISALRAKLEKIDAQTHICTYRGQGYALEV